MSSKLSPKAWTNLIIAIILFICLFGAVFSISIIVRKRPNTHAPTKTSPTTNTKSVTAQAEKKENNKEDIPNKNNIQLQPRPNSEEIDDKDKEKRGGGKCPFGFDRPTKPVKRVRFDVDENDKPIPRNNRPFMVSKNIPVK